MELKKAIEIMGQHVCLNIFDKDTLTAWVTIKAALNTTDGKCIECGGGKTKSRVPSTVCEECGCIYAFGTDKATKGGAHPNGCR